MFSAYRLQRTKLNKNNFCVSRSRLGGDTENSSCEGAYITQLSRNLLGLIHVYAQDNRLRCVRKCVSYCKCDVSTDGIEIFAHHSTILLRYDC